MKKKILIIAIITAGLTSVIAQVAMMRELLVVFYGNELCIGIMLASWLIWVACGSAISGFLVKKGISSVNLFLLIQVLTALLLPVTLILIKLTRNIFKISQVEIIGIGPAIFIPLVILAGICTLIGLQFSSACRLFTEINEDKPVSNSISKVYMYEAAGWFAGGVLFNYVLAGLMNNYYILLGLVIINMLIAFLMAVLGKKLFFASLTFIMMITCAVFTFSPASAVIYNNVLKKQWPGDYKLLASVDSFYGNVTVRERKKQVSIYQNGILDFTSDDTLYNEELVHLTMLRAPYVKNVFLIGGGVSGVLEEILKYPMIEKVWYAELDPLIIELGKKYLKPGSLNNKRVTVLNTDARLFLKSMGRENILDVIMVNLPDPSTAQLNRYYTLDFFKEANKTMKASGILSIGMSSSQDYISEELKEFNGAVYKAIKKVFKNTLIIPGEHILFLASQERYLPVDNDFMALNLNYLKSPTRYISKEYISSRLNRARAAYVRKRLDSYENEKLNTDFYPVAYYRCVKLWAASYNIQANKYFNWLQNHILFKNMVIMVFIITLIVIIFFNKNRINGLCIYTAAVAGFVSMSCEIILIMMFQVFYGCVYSGLGMLTAAYMIGAAAGSLAMNRKEYKETHKWLKIIQGSMFVYLLILPAVFSGYALLSQGLIVLKSTQVIFPILSLLTGCFTGAIFSLINKIWLSQRSLQDRRISLTEAGAVYGIDLAGAAIGVFVTGIVLIPLLGIIPVCFFLGILTIGNLSLLLIRL